MHFGYNFGRKMFVWRLKLCGLVSRGGGGLVSFDVWPSLLPQAPWNAPYVFILVYCRHVVLRKIFKKNVSYRDKGLQIHYEVWTLFAFDQTRILRTPVFWPWTIQNFVVADVDAAHYFGHYPGQHWSHCQGRQSSFFALKAHFVFKGMSAGSDLCTATSNRLWTCLTFTLIPLAKLNLNHSV